MEPHLQGGENRGMGKWDNGTPTELKSGLSHRHPMAMPTMTPQGLKLTHSPGSPMSMPTALQPFSWITQAMGTKNSMDDEESELSDGHSEGDRK